MDGPKIVAFGNLGDRRRGPDNHFIFVNRNTPKLSQTCDIDDGVGRIDALANANLQIRAARQQFARAVRPRDLLQRFAKIFGLEVFDRRLNDSLSPNRGAEFP